jgi:hypothetical protein
LEAYLKAEQTCGPEKFHHFCAWLSASLDECRLPAFGGIKALFHDLI